MKILAVDDERLALQLLTDTIQKVLPEAEVFSFGKAGEALDCAQENHCDIAFLDVRMRSMTGLELARKLKNIYPKINIIFVTGYNEYVGEAMRLHASGYIEKPVTAEKVRQEVDDLRHPIISQQSGALLRVACFGSFEVYTQNGTAMHFERAKAKECFAYLISRRGASCSVRDLANILFEESSYDMKQSAYTRKILSSMAKSLREVGAEAVLHKSYNEVSLDTQKIDCDYYHFLRGEVSAVNQYQGEFMSQYSWAELITGQSIMMLSQNNISRK